MESPFLGTFNTHLDMFLCNVVQVTLPGQVVGLEHMQRSLPISLNIL